MADRYFLRGHLIAVKVSGAWKYYDPATPYLPCGFQDWGQQGTPVLIPDAKQPEWAMAPVSRAGESVESHTAHFRLDQDGGISGQVQMKYTGHLANYERRQLLGKGAAEREQYLIDEMKRQFASPDISQVKWDGVENTEIPVTVSFTMKLPGYVQRTGKRIFVQPAVFQRGYAARFTGSTREHPVYFHFPWSESDEVSIEVPEGYEFDHPDIPPSIKAGDTVTWKVTARIENKTTLVYHRDFSFGDDGNILLPQSAYPNIRKVFDAMHEGDEHTFALKQAAAR
jgi:hypothetical protein